jgi:hypothetical protein
MRLDMNRALIVTLVAAAALAGCDNGSNTIVQEGPTDPMANALANAAPVEVPPAITASKAYRCKDNSLIYIDWLSDGSARVKKSRDEYTAPTVTPGEDGSPLSGTSDAASVTYSGQSCKA